MKIVETNWRCPITVRLQSGLDHTFKTIGDTLDFLENEWPTRSGPRRHRAVELCQSAMNRIAPAEVAREAVLAACIEADMALIIPSTRADRHQTHSVRAA